MTVKQAAAIGCFLLASSAFCLDAYADVPDNLRENDSTDILDKVQDGTKTHEYFHYVDQQADFLDWDLGQVVAEGKGIINSSNHEEETCTILQPSFSDSTTEYDVIYGAYAGEYVLKNNYTAKLFHMAKACDNKLNLQGDYLKSRLLWGAYASSKYYFQLEGDTFKSGFAYADGNTVTINNAKTSVATVGAYAVYGHYVETRPLRNVTMKYATSADGNTVCVNGGEHGSVIGSMASLDEIYFGWEAGAFGDRDQYNNLKVSISSVSSSGNTLILQGGKYTYNSDTVAHTDEAPFTSFGITAGAVYLNAVDAFVQYEDGAVQAKDNTLVLTSDANGKKPEFDDNMVLYGGLVVAKNLIPNCTLPDRQLSYLPLYDVSKADTSGNTLEINNVTRMTAGNIANFDTLKYEYDSLKAGDVILELKGNTVALEVKTATAYGANKPENNEYVVKSGQKTDISNAKVSVSVGSLFGSDGKGEFMTGDKVVLLKNENGLVTDGIETETAITATTGISLTYVVEIQTSEDELFLTRTGTKPVEDDDDSDKTDDDSGKTDDNNSGTEILPGTKAIAEGAAAGLALVNESSNAAIELLREFSLTAGSITPFVHVQASSMRHETGSSINLSTVSLVAGLGTGIDTGAGHLSAGAFFEYGKGSYTTHNSFDTRSEVDGDGNSWYMGGGILAKMEFLQTGPGHFYAEGSAHMGTMHNEFDSNDLRDANGTVAKFDMDSPYYSLHGGLGYVWNMAEGHDLDIYGKYIWTRVQGTDDTLTTRDRFEYDDMDSNRIRLGVRYAYNGSERFKPYVGAAFEHEFSGSCDSRVFGYSVAAPSFEGSSGMGELGLVMKPSESLPLSINLGVQGYVGQKQGVSGNCAFKYEF